MTRTLEKDTPSPQLLRRCPRPRLAGLLAAWIGTTLSVAPWATAQTPSTAEPDAFIRSLSAQPDGRLRLDASFPSNRLFSLQGSTDLVHWRRVAPVNSTDASSGSAELEPPAGGCGFYRLAREATMFRFGPRHIGVCDTEGIATTNVSLAWKFQTADQVVASPAVVGGVVYVGSVDTNFYALDAETGLERWRFRTAGAIRSSAAVVDGRVYFSSRDGHVYALNGSDGQELWRCKIAETNQTASVDNWDYFDSSPTLVEGVIYVGSGDRRLYAIDARTGQTNWTYSTQGKVRSTPAVVDGRVYFGGLDRYFYALDAASGTNVWKYRVQGNGGFPNGEIYHAPAVLDGVVYFGSRDSALYALDAVTGTNKWRRAVCGGSSWVFNSPAVWNGRVYLGTSIPAYLIALDLVTGQEKWSLSLPAQEYSSPVIADGIAYFGIGDALSTCTSPAHPRPVPAYLYAVNLTTRSVFWRFRTPGHIYSSPAVVDGAVYFGCLDGCVYALR
jgi:outer membrane protein assembly factor BamB